jgi:2-iminobutanoate/2-iminopropanoate deaminase
MTLTKNTGLRLVSCLLLGIVAQTTNAFAQPGRQIVAPPGWTVAGAVKSSPGVRGGDLLHVAGVMATDASGSIIKGGIDAQTRRAFENVGTVLRAGGMDFKDVVLVTVFLADRRDVEGMNKAYREVFRTNPPTRAAVQADLMLRDALVQVSVIAARPDLPRRYINPVGWGTSPAYASRAIAVGEYVFVSGIVSQDPRTGAVLEGDIALQTKQVMDSAKTLVETAGFQMSDLVVSRVWLEDARDFQAMNDVYRTYFNDSPPTRATVRTDLATPNTAYKVEIQLWGMKGEKTRLGGPITIPFSRGIKVGNYVFVAGLTAGGQPPGDIRGQTTNTLAAVGKILAEGGQDFTNAVEAEVWVTDSRHFAGMDEAYTQYVRGDQPTRSTIGTQLMGTSAVVEITLIAVK